MVETENTTISLGELFDKKELKDIQNFVKQNKWKELREYLNSHPLKDELYNKGVLADYLYYWLENNFKTNEVKK